jgi:hypothetical protein
MEKLATRSLRHVENGGERISRMMMTTNIQRGKVSGEIRVRQK